MISRGAEALGRDRIKPALTGGVSLAALALVATTAHAQGPAPAPPAAAKPAAASPTAPISTNRDAKATAAAAKAKAKAAQDEEDEVSELVVTAGRPQVGAVIGDIKPELQLSPQDVMSYGVSTVTELLDELAPQTRSDRGRGGEAPVVLLNGRRISGFQEIRDIPVEAILRVDILPEEVALKYGYTANQRVVNIVLRRFFRATTVEVTGGAPTEGGEFIGQGEIDEFHVVRDDRLNLDLKVSGHSNLLESDRDVTSIAAGQPFDLLGNVMSPTAGGEIDPALSARAGRPITVAGVPAVAATRAPTLADFGPTAGVQNSTDVSHDRTLLASNQSVAANAVLSRTLPYKFAGTVNGTLEATRSDALQGLSGIALNVPVGDVFSPFGQPVTVDRYVNPNDPLKQTATTWSAHLGGTLNRDISKWRTSLTGAYDHAVSDTDTDVGIDPAPAQALLDARSQTFNPFAQLPTQLLVMQPENKADSTSDTANVQFLANGPTFINVPAGALYASFKLGDSPNWFASQSSRLGVNQSVDLQRNDFTVQGNFDLPIADHAKGVLPIFGKLSANLHLVLDELSDFGTLETIGGGLNWTPFTGWNLIVSHTHDEAAPTPQQLGGPVITTTGSRIFDYSTGRTVDVTSISGGTRDLVSDSREVTKIGLTVKPIPTQELTFTANYIVSKITNPIQSFPAATAAIEAAFPDRFLRDGTGQLIQVDNRPVNFASSSRSELRYGLNYSRPFGPQPPPRQFGRRPPGAPQPGSLDPQAEQRRRVTQGDGGAAPASPDGGAPAGGGPPGGGPGGFGGPGGGGPGGGFGGGRGGGGGGRGGGGGGGGPGGPQGGRLQFAIYHTVFFEDQLLIRPGVPALDLLNGAAAGSTGGQPQHEVEVQAGLTYQGLGARLSADWKSGTVVRGGATSATGDLDFSDIGTINLRLWDDLNQQPNVLKAAPWLRGSRITLNITNLFDERIRVRDANGNTPVSYQPAYLDPTGRVIRLSFRKLFYSIPQRGQRPAGFPPPGRFAPGGPPGD